jgi:phage terminase small subunit
MTLQEAMNELTPRQRRFVEEYLIDLNATRSAKTAGYAESSASVAGSELLANPKIATAVTIAQAERSARTAITADRVLREVARLAFFDAGEVFDFTGGSITLKPGSEIPEDARRAIVGVKLKQSRAINGEPKSETLDIRLADKRASLELLMRHMGLFNDKLLIQGSGTFDPKTLSDAELNQLAVILRVATVQPAPGETSGSDGDGEPPAAP